MRNTRRDGRKTAALAIGLALGGGWTGIAQAQMTSGPGLSSGTGAGTGAGGFSGVIRNRSDSISGVGPQYMGGIRGGVDSLRSGPRTGSVTFGPGVDVSFPNDPYLLPFLLPETTPNPIEGKTATEVTSDLLDNARKIADPAERSLALRQIANGAIASNQLGLAHHTLEEAITAASQVNVPLVRDQRLIGLVTSMNFSTDSLLRVSREALGTTAALEPIAARPAALPNRPETLKDIRQFTDQFDKELAAGNFNKAMEQFRSFSPMIQEKVTKGEITEAEGKVFDSQFGGAMARKLKDSVIKVMIPLARLEWRRAVYLASIIGNPTYRNEMLYKVAESEALGSATLSNDFAGTDEGESMGNRPAPAAGQPARPAPPATAMTRDAQENAAYAKLADEVLVDAWNVANGIDRLIWKNRAMVKITLSASDSKQFPRARQLAQRIQNAESRTEAMLILAEAQCREGLGNKATETYQAAALAAAAITQDGLRGVMVGYLVDSLLSTGRFDDARACTAIYPEESERFVALGAIAESQGKRGLAASARQWIATDTPERYRSALYRRVAAGVLWSVEQARSKESPAGEGMPPER
ncbi:MAG: hypothetical protein ACLQGP_14320 [Isosphaeraceae bacterium]